MQDLDAIQGALQQLRSGELGVHAFSSRARSCDAVLKALPSPYRHSLFDALDRLELSVLFGDPGSEVTRTGLLEEVQCWIDQARAELGPTR